MSRFVHEFLAPRYDLERVSKDDGRWYVLPNGKHVRSVTTILDKLNKKDLDRWRERVGIEEATQVSTQAKTRGTAVHELCEKYLLNEENIQKGAMPFNYMTFLNIKKILDKNVKKIYGIEYRLFSEELNCAGTTDLICCWNNSNTVVDFKTSKYQKKEENIRGYFLQSSCYALMAEALYGIKIPNITIIIAVDHEEPVIFEKSKDEFLDDVYEIFKT